MVAGFGTMNDESITIGERDSSGGPLLFGILTAEKAVPNTPLKFRLDSRTRSGCGPMTWCASATGLL
jgi:hypothetical protein